MRVSVIVSVALALFWGNIVSAFTVAPSLPICVRSSPLAQQSSLWAKKKEQKDSASTNQGPDIKSFLRILVTGSPDGISLIGKPQHNWVTNKKEYTATKGPRQFGLKINLGGRKADNKTKK